VQPATIRSNAGSSGARHSPPRAIFALAFERLSVTTGRVTDVPAAAGLRWRGALRWPAFRRYYLGQGLSQFGDGLIGVALAFGVLSVTRSATALSLVLLASRLPLIAFTVIGGVIGDRWSRRTVMLGCDLVRVVTQGLTAGLLLTGQAQVWQLAVLQGIAGTAQAFFAPAAGGLVAGLVDAEDLQSANALLGTTRSVSSLAAPIASAGLIALIGPGLSFAVDAASFAASALALVGLSRSIPGGGNRDPLWQSARHGWRQFRSRRWLWTTTAHLTVLNGLGIAPVLVLGPLIAARHLGGATAWASISLGYGSGAIAGTVLLTRWRPAHPLLISVAGSTLITPFLLGLAVPAPAWLLAGLAVPAGAQASVYNVLQTATAQRLIPAELLSRVTSIAMIGGLAITPLAMAATGPVADAIGTRPLLLAVVSVLIASSATVLLVPDVRRLTVRPQESPARSPA
jgi:MFS family permease